MARQITQRSQLARRRIFIVDDHPIFRDGLAHLVNGEVDLQVCGEADSAGAALDGVLRSKPALVLLDIGLPGKSGLELIKDLRVTCPEAAVLVISMHEESLYAERVLRAGAQGYLMKQEGPEKMLQAIRDVLNGRISLSEQMSAKVLNIFAGQRLARGASPIEQLTDREFEILQLIGRGKGNHEIACQLHVSSKTVDAHRSHIKQKLKMRSSPELICYAARWVEANSTASR